LAAAFVDSRGISPTALYTGYVWCRNGLAPPGFATALGRAMYLGLRGPVRAGAKLAGRLDLEQLLLQRHLIIDALLERAVSAGLVGQVVEVAAGLSARGWRFTRRYPGLRYLEADLPHMAARKRALLDRIGDTSPALLTVAVDALCDDGPLALTRVCAERLRADRGTAIITEGLLSYFPTPTVRGMWARFALALGRYPYGLYLSDLQLDDALHGRLLVRLFRAFLAFCTGARVSVHFPSDALVRQALVEAGFGSAAVHRAADHPEIEGLAHAERGDLTAVLAAHTLC
jgi:O-methyltransferase involved in polyketide biosynthesis